MNYFALGQRFQFIPSSFDYPKGRNEGKTLFNKAKLVEKYKGSGHLHKLIINHTGA